jgi:hypothetical protein
MDSHSFLRQIFEGYVLTMRRRNHSSEHGLDDDTRRELEHFSALGEALGYFASFENKRAEIKMDLSWWTTSYLSASRFAVSPASLVLHLERESYRAKNYETIERLLADRSPAPPFHAGVLANVFRGNLAALQQYVESQVGSRNLLLIAWINEIDGGVHGGDFRECLGIVHSGTRRSMRRAHTSKDRAGFWYAYFDAEQWSDLR